MRRELTVFLSLSIHLFRDLSYSHSHSLSLSFILLFFFFGLHLNLCVISLPFTCSHHVPLQYHPFPFSMSIFVYVCRSVFLSLLRFDLPCCYFHFSSSANSWISLKSKGYINTYNTVCTSYSHTLKLNNLHCFGCNAMKISYFSYRQLDF